VTVQERCQRLRQNVSKHDQTRRAHKDAAAFTARATELKETKDGFALTLGKLAVLRENNVSTGREPDPNPALTLLEQCTKDLRANSEDLGRVFGSFKRSGSALLTKLEAGVRRGIEAVEHELPKVDETFLSQVELVPGLGAQVASIREKRDRLLKGKNLHEMTGIELRNFLQQRDLLKKDADNLDRVDFPKEVLDFFKAARQGDGAPYGKFSSAVELWLKDRKLLDRIRLRVVDR
jgi:hypothetical protein